MTPRETELSRKLEECQAALKQSLRENELLRQKIDLLVRRVFGSSSERLDRSQLELLLQLSQNASVTEKEVTTAPVRSSNHSARKRAPRLPDHLPVVEEVIDPEPVKAQPERWRLHRPGSQRTVGLRAGPLSKTTTHSPQIRSLQRSGQRPGDCAVAGAIARSQPARAGTAGAYIGEQILRSPAALSAGTNLRATLRNQFIQTNTGALGRVGGWMVKANLRTDPHRGHGRWLCAGGRNTD